MVRTKCPVLMIYCRYPPSKNNQIKLRNFKDICAKKTKVNSLLLSLILKIKTKRKVPSNHNKLLHVKLISAVNKCQNSNMSESRIKDKKIRDK